MKKQIKSKKSKKNLVLNDVDFSKGVRGKYAKKMREGYSVTIYSPNKKAVEAETYIKIERDVAKFFSNSESVNAALRHLLAAMPTKGNVKKAA